MSKAMITHDIGTRRIWYDPGLRLWTMQERDRRGNQVGDVDYTPDRKTAFDWLKGGGEA